MSSGEVDEMEKKSRAQQTAERLYNQIVVEGRWKAGEKLPNELELARALGVTVQTVDIDGGVFLDTVLENER